MKKPKPRPEMEYVTCPLCGKECLALWNRSDGKSLNPTRCSVCLRTVGSDDVTVTQAQEILARQLEGINEKDEAEN